MLNNLVTNHKNWETYEIEKPEGQQTPEAVAEAEEEHETPNLSSSSELLLPRRSSLTPARPSTFREQLRRFSVPLNVFQDGRSRNRDAVIARGANGGVNEDDADYEQAPEYCSDKLLAESSIASITTPAEAMRMCHVFHERNWKLIRQPTFPPLEMMSRAHSLIPRASSQGESIYPRAVKSDSGIRLESNHDDHRLGSRPESRIGSRLRDNLVFIPLDLGRRRKSMPARAEPMSEYQHFVTLKNTQLSGSVLSLC